MTRWMTLLLVPALAGSLFAQETKPAPAQEPTMAATQPAPTDQLRFVVLDTTQGEIVLELNETRTPITVKNFLDYVQAGHYNGLIFHRVMSNFMIQGGGYTPDLTEKTDGLRPPIKNEWQAGYKNVRGTISMARTNVPDSATAQFFINVVDNPNLDKGSAATGGAGYAAFGRVIGGMDVVDKIRNTRVKEDPKLPMGRVVPVEPIVINTARVLTADEAQATIKAAADKAAKAAEEKAKAEAEAKAAGEKQVQDFVAALERETGKKVEKTASGSGLMFLIEKEGTGPQPSKSDTVEVHYTGTLLDGTKFDSSRDRGQPFSFSLSGGVIQGWLEGVALMKVGEQRKLIIPPNLGYGVRGSPPKIPPNAWLVFDVELLGIKGK